jgi:hypothetical protein
MFGKKLVCFSADLVSLQQLVLLLRQKLGAFSTYHQMAIVFDPPSNVRRPQTVIFCVQSKNVQQSTFTVQQVIGITLMSLARWA